MTVEYDKFNHFFVNFDWWSCVYTIGKTMENASDFRLVIVTTNSYDNAQQIARILLSEGLAACCNLLLGAYSMYTWKGHIEEALEVMIFIKTTTQRIEMLEQRVKELHPYKVPEVITVPIESGSEPYLRWIARTVAPQEMPFDDMEE